MCALSHFDVVSVFVCGMCAVVLVVHSPARAGVWRGVCNSQIGVLQRIDNAWEILFPLCRRPR